MHRNQSQHQLQLVRQVQLVNQNLSPLLPVPQLLAQQAKALPFLHLRALLVVLALVRPLRSLKVLVHQPLVVLLSPPLLLPVPLHHLVHQGQALLHYLLLLQVQVVLAQAHLNHR